MFWWKEEISFENINSFKADDRGAKSESEFSDDPEEQEKMTNKTGASKPEHTQYIL